MQQLGSKDKVSYSSGLELSISEDAFIKLEQNNQPPVNQLTPVAVLFHSHRQGGTKQKIAVDFQHAGHHMVLLMQTDFLLTDMPLLI